MSPSRAHTAHLCEQIDAAAEQYISITIPTPSAWSYTQAHWDCEYSEDGAVGPAVSALQQITKVTHFQWEAEE